MVEELEKRKYSELYGQHDFVCKDMATLLYKIYGWKKLSPMEECKEVARRKDEYNNDYTNVKLNPFLDFYHSDVGLYNPIDNEIKLLDVAMLTSFKHCYYAKNSLLELKSYTDISYNAEGEMDMPHLGLWLRKINDFNLSDGYLLFCLSGEFAFLIAREAVEHCNEEYEVLTLEHESGIDSDYQKIQIPASPEFMKFIEVPLSIRPAELGYWKFNWGDTEFDFFWKYPKAKYKRIQENGYTFPMRLPTPKDFSVQTIDKDWYNKHKKRLVREFAKYDIIFEGIKEYE